MRLLIGFLLLAAGSQLFAQGRDTTAQKLAIDSINRLLDRAVVAKNKAVLEKHYAPDFFFTHGTGALDSKESWINAAMKPENIYVSREHDSTKVELHGDIGLITGTLTVKRATAGYALRYIRIYAWRQNAGSCCRIGRFRNGSCGDTLSF